MNRFRLSAVLLTAVVLQGCAYLTHYQASIGEPSTGVSMDAKQRVVLVNNAPAGSTDKWRRMCAEPSPDALSALSASFGLSLLDGSEKAKQLSGALAESAGSIGLRTSSIQLMRDAMFRACESYLNGGISKDRYAELQEQGQTMVVGLLAIEQLTGAVKADSLALITAANSSSLPSTEKEYQNLQLAIDSVVEKKEGKDMADAAVVDAQKNVDSKALAAEAPEAKPEGPAHVKAQEELTLAKAELEKRQRLAKSAKDALALAEQRRNDADGALSWARSRVAIAISGEGKFNSSNKSRMSDETAKAVAKTVSDIVARVVTRDALDRCVDEIIKEKPSDEVKALCGKLIELKSQALKNDAVRLNQVPPRNAQ
jgi:hypothetical protein